jgi:GTPase SAR1 family protein
MKPVLDSISFIDKKYQRLITMLQQGTRRQTPFCLMLVGPPGTGKTTLTRHLAVVACKTFQPDQAIDSCLYTRHSTDKFWNSYYNQFCTAIDYFCLDTGP